jgi:hypothetical protein
MPIPPQGMGGKMDVTVSSINLDTYYRATIDFRKILVSNTLALLPIEGIKKIYSRPMVIECVDILSYKIPIKSYLYEVGGIIHFVDDNRHTPDIDVEDTTAYNSPYNITLQYDYSSVISFKQVYIKFETSRTSAGLRFWIQISQDGTTWTTIYYSENVGLRHINFYDLTFRYLKFYMENVTPGTSGVTLKVYKIILIK